MIEEKTHFYNTNIICFICVCRQITNSGPALANAKMSQTSDGNLQISDVSEEDSSMYTCSVRHSNRSISAELVVLSKSNSVQTFRISE